MHMNNFGKEMLANKITEEVMSVFKQKKKPIILPWTDEAASVEKEESHSDKSVLVPISEMRREPLQKNNEVSSTSNPNSELGNKPNCITTDIGLRKSTRVKKPASEGQNDFLWESDMKK